MLLTRRPVAADAVATLVGGEDNIAFELVAISGRGARSLRGVRPGAPRAVSPTPRLAARGSETRARFSSRRRPSSATTQRARRTSCRRVGSRARAGGLGLERFLKPRQFVRADARERRARDRAAARARRGTAAPRARRSEPRMTRGARCRRTTRPVGWAPSSADGGGAARARPAQVLRFDRNTPPLPGVPQVPLAESFARLNEYHDGTFRDLREAAARTPASRRSRSSSAQAPTS